MRDKPNKPRPPKSAIRFIENRLENYAEDLIGDLEELYQREYNPRFPVRARLLFWFRAIYFTYSITGRTRKKNLYQNNNRISVPITLYSSYFKVAFRNIAKNRLFTTINVVGLALGMSVGLLIISMTLELVKFDEFHANKDSIYRVITRASYFQRSYDDRSTTCEPVAGLLKQNTGVEEVVRIQKRLAGMARTGTKELPVNGYFADESFFRVFSFPFILGGFENNFHQPNKLILTRETALKLYNSIDVVDSILQVGELGDYTIIGILEDPPKASHLQFEMIASYATVPVLERDNILTRKEGEWGAINDTYVYFQIKDNGSSTSIEEVLNNEAQRRYPEINYVDASFKLQNLRKIVPGPELSNAIGPKMIDTAIYIMSGIAFLILLSATFNYAHLSSARLLQKSREIGLRKVIGGTRKQLFLQFLSETIIIAFLALSLSMGIFLFIRPHFLAIIPRASEMLDLRLTTELLGWFAIFTLFVGILSGTLPALFFSKLNPVQALKKVGARGKKFIGRKGLVVAQFTLSIIFIFGVFTISKQYSYSIAFDLGFNRENIVTFSSLGTDPDLVKSELSKLAPVLDVSMASLRPASGSTQTSWLRAPGEPDSSLTYYMSVSPNFISTMELEIVSGKNFDGTINDQSSIIVNQKLANYLGLTQADAPGNLVIINGVEFRILGVIKDFNYNQLEEPIENFYFVSDPSQFYRVFLKVAAGNPSNTLSLIEDSWKQLTGGKYFNAAFLEDDLEEAYAHFGIVMKVFGFLGTLAISIACLGLLGITVYTLEIRIKEVGIRKVMGASVLSLIGILSRHFLILMGLAIIVGIPIAYVFFSQVMLPISFYHTTISFKEIFLTILLLIGVGVITIASQTLRAASTNPAEVLRNE